MEKITPLSYFTQLNLVYARWDSYQPRVKWLFTPWYLFLVWHIRKTDGFLGLYRGLGARLCSGIVSTVVTNHASWVCASSIVRHQNHLDETKIECIYCGLTCTISVERIYLENGRFKKVKIGHCWNCTSPSTPPACDCITSWWFPCKIVVLKNMSTKKKTTKKH